MRQIVLSYIGIIVIMLSPLAWDVKFSIQWCALGLALVIVATSERVDYILSELRKKGSEK